MTMYEYDERWRVETALRDLETACELVHDPELAYAEFLELFRELSAVSFQTGALTFFECVGAAADTVAQKIYDLHDR